MIIIGQRAEVQPLHEGVELAGGVAEIDGRADQQHVGGKNPIQQRAQIVLPEAFAALSLLALAKQAAAAAPEDYSTVTLFARFRGLSTSRPFVTET